MEVNRKKLLVVGDRVLVAPEENSSRTRDGLYLPAAAVEKMAVQSGKIIEVGPGTPVPNPNEFGDEPWKLQEQGGGAKYVPMEANVGDTALFLKNAAVEIEFEGETYLVVPHAAILLLVRGSDEKGSEDEDDATEFREEDFKI
ncbi:MAG: co-chaperone GroES family protein [Planctomycetota bacterium]